MRVETSRSLCLRDLFPVDRAKHVESAFIGTNTGNTCNCGDETHREHMCNNPITASQDEEHRQAMASLVILFKLAQGAANAGENLRSSSHPRPRSRRPLHRRNQRTSRQATGRFKSQNPYNSNRRLINSCRWTLQNQETCEYSVSGPKLVFNHTARRIFERLRDEHGYRVHGALPAERCSTVARHNLAQASVLLAMFRRRINSGAELDGRVSQQRCIE